MLRYRVGRIHITAGRSPLCATPTGTTLHPSVRRPAPTTLCAPTTLHPSVHPPAPASAHNAVRAHYAAPVSASASASSAPNAGFFPFPAHFLAPRGTYARAVYTTGTAPPRRTRCYFSLVQRP